MRKTAFKVCILKASNYVFAYSLRMLKLALEKSAEGKIKRPSDFRGSSCQRTLRLTDVTWNLRKVRWNVSLGIESFKLF